MGGPKKNRMKKAAPAPVLPDEMVEEILARLPAKSLRRFQCVSRSWHGLITSPRFRQLHSSRVKLKPRGLFFRPPGNRNTGSFHACPQFGIGGGPVVVDKEKEILSSALFAQGPIFPINTNSCHGLVLLCCLDYGAYYVWNPSTGDILALPDRTPFRTAGYNKPHPFIAYGLGYCSTTHQYKVVRMYNDTFCEVFTLDQSTYWRPAATEPPPPTPPSRRPQVRGGQGAVFCNGSLHFVAEDGVITSFNVTDETFGTLVPPQGILEHSVFGFDLTELDGCLCAFFSCQVPTPSCPCYHIWLLRDYDAASKGCRGGWEVIRCFDWSTMADAQRKALSSHWVAPLAMYNNKKKIMFGTGSCKVFVVDLPSSSSSNNNNHSSPPVMTHLFSSPQLQLEEEDYGVVEQDDDGHFATMGFYEESLVPVGRTVDDIILSSPPADAWCQVLSRLPARTVGRLTQVCKDWRAIIKSDCFVVDSHLQYHLANNHLPQIMLTDGKPNGFKPLEDFIIDTSQVPPLVDDDDRCSRLVYCSKPCHGLNAGAFTSHDFVCNPITGYYQALPLDDDGPSGEDMFAGRLGLGYDVEIGVHVLVRITFKERNLTTRDYKLDCELRTIGDDTMFWEELDPPPRPIADTPPAYLSGKIYWMADSKLLAAGQTSSSGYDEIIALDIAAREFQILKGPPRSHSSSSDERVSIVELQGRICVVCSHPRLDCMEIWAIEGNGSWSMEYYIDLRRFTPEYSAELVTPIAIDPRDGRILLSTGRALGYYDPKMAEVQTIYCLGKHINKHKKFVSILYQESLVTPCDQVNY